MKQHIRNKTLHNICSPLKIAIIKQRFVDICTLSLAPSHAGISLFGVFDGHGGREALHAIILILRGKWGCEFDEAE